MNIIFLDIDGVLNSTDNLIKVYNQTHKPHSGYNYPFDNECLNNLKELVFNAKAAIVVTSSWRKTKEGKEKLLSALKNYKLDTFLIGYTPVLESNRGKEIKKYLDEIQTNEPINIVILDDDNDMNELSQYLVKTKMQTGLTKENVNEALTILKMQKERKIKKYLCYNNNR